MAFELVRDGDVSALVESLVEQPKDMLREMLHRMLGAVMQVEFDEQIGAEHYERSDGRKNRRNGFRSRRYDTRLGSIDLEVPRPREGGFQPSFLEHRARSERALLAAVAEIYVSGISTRKVRRVLHELGVAGISKSAVSNICKGLDAEVKAFRERPLTLTYPYLMLDALYEKLRIDGRVISQAVVIAYAVSELGFREVLGVDVVNTESKESWSHFLRSLVARGLRGVRLVVSDCHLGLKAAIAELLPGASWQRCRVHLLRNVLAHVPHSRKFEIVALFRSVFTQPTRSAALGQAKVLVAPHRKMLAKAIEILDDGLEDALAFFDFPVEHHRKLWSTNPIEHLNSELRRRTRTVGIFPNVDAAIRLITSVLIEQTEEWSTERRYLNEESMKHALTMSA